MIFGQTPTNITQEPKVSLQEQRSQSVKHRFWTKPLRKASMEPQKVPEPLETIDYISLQEQEENPSKERKERNDAGKHENSF